MFSYQTYSSPAYTITKQAIFTIGTTSVFPNGFPQDFSILLVLKSNNTRSMTNSPVFTIYSAESDDVLSVTVGRNIGFVYQEFDGPFDHKNIIDFGIGIDDNKWHRIGISVKGNSVTLLLDCVNKVVKRLEREIGKSIATDGLILTGLQLADDQGFFTGDIQMMAVVEKPDAAFGICSKYAVDCRTGFVGNSHHPFRLTTGSESTSSGPLNNMGTRFETDFNYGSTRRPNSGSRIGVLSESSLNSNDANRHTWSSSSSGISSGSISLKTKHPIKRR